MRSDRGRFCFPEVNIKIPFSPATHDIAQLLPNKQALKDMMLMGTAYTGKQCAELQIVDSIHPASQLQDQAIALATTLATKDRNTFTIIRNLMRPAIQAHLSRLTSE